MNQLPDFIVQKPPISDPESPPPYRFDHVGIQLFLVLADGKKLQLACDWFLNQVARQNDAPFRIEPLMGTGLGVVNIQLLRYPRMYSVAPGHEQLGYAVQHELLFSIPVVLKRYGIPQAVGLFTPFLCVDNSNSMITGREVVGFAKVGGHFELPDHLYDIRKAEVSTLAIQTESATEPVRRHLLLETSASGDALMLPDGSALSVADVSGPNFGALEKTVAKPLWPYGPIDEIYSADQQFAVDERVLALLKLSAGVSMNNYTLKQFRDAEVPNKACYQAIVQSDSDIYDFHAGGVLPGADIRIHKYASVDIIGELGLDASGNSIKPLYGLWYHAGFYLRNLKNLTVRCGATVDNSRGGSHGCVELIGGGTRAVLSLYRGMALAWLRMLDDRDRPRDGQENR